MEGAGQSAHQATLYHFPAVPADQGGHSWLEISQCDTYKKGEKNYRFVSPTSVLEKFMDQIIPSGMCRTTRGSDSANMGLWKAGTACLT